MGLFHALMRCVTAVQAFYKKHAGERGSVNREKSRSLSRLQTIYTDRKARAAEGEPVREGGGSTVAVLRGQMAPEMRDQRGRPC